MNFNFGDYTNLPLSEGRVAICLVCDVSGSMSIYDRIMELNTCLNRFPADVCKDSKAAELVDLCVITFNEDARVVQDWMPINQLKNGLNLHLTAHGGTNMAAALELADKKVCEQAEFYEDAGGGTSKKPFLVVMSDGDVGNIDAILEKIRGRRDKGKYRVNFVGVNGYNRQTAEKLTVPDQIFEVHGEEGYDFTDFFDIMTLSLRTVSQKGDGEASGMSKLDKWLNS